MPCFLLILSALIAFLPHSGLIPASTQSFIASGEQTTTYEVISAQTSYVSTTGFIIDQTPLDLTARGIGFVAPKGKCAQFEVPLTVTAGTRLNMAMTSTEPSNLYLLRTYAFQSSPNKCQILGDVLFSETNFTAYNLHWTAPENGTIYLTFTGPTTVIIVMDHGSTKPDPEMGNITYATTETSSLIDASTLTTTYTTTTPIATAFLLQGLADYAIPIGIGILIAALIMILQSARKRRRT